MGAGGPPTGEGSGGRWGPQQGTGAEPCWGSRGQSLRKQNEFNVLALPNIAFPQRNSSNSHFLKRTVLLMIDQLFYIFILNKFWSRWLIKNSRAPLPQKKILKSRVLQMPFPAFSRGISHQKDNHNQEQKTVIKSTFVVSSSCTCYLGYFSIVSWCLHTQKVYLDKLTKLQKRISANTA